MKLLFEPAPRTSSVLAPAASTDRAREAKPRAPREEASAAGGGDGADADRFMAHLKQSLQEFDEAAL